MYENDVEWVIKTISPELLLSLFVGTDFIYGKTRLYSLAYLYHRCGICGFKDINDWDIKGSGQFGITSQMVSKSVRLCIEKGYLSKTFDIKDNGKKSNERYIIEKKGLDILFNYFKDNFLDKEYIKVCHIKYHFSFLNWRLIYLVTCVLLRSNDTKDFTKIACEVFDNMNLNNFNDDSIITSALDIIEGLIATNFIKV